MRPQSTVRFQSSADPWRMRLGARTYDPPPADSAFGPTSVAGFSDSGAGLLVGAGVTPLGWSRLTRLPAEAAADRILPLSDVLGEAAATLAAQVRGAGPTEALRAVFDAFFLGRLSPPTPDDLRIAALHRLLMQESPMEVSLAAEQLGVTVRTLGRLSRRAFAQRLMAVGLTAPLAAQLLAHAGVAMAQSKSSYKPTRRGGGGLLIYG